MFKSEITNRIISLIVLLMILTFVLLKDSKIISNPILLLFTAVFVILVISYQIYKISILMKSNRK